jgi:hypothetical protein
MTLKVQIWLKDGSIFKDWILTQAEIKVGGLAFDMNTFEKLDHAYLYVAGGSKIYRDRVTGNIDVRGPSMTDSLKLAIDQVEDMVRSVTAGGN